MRSKSRVVTRVLAVIFFLVSGFVFLERQALFDWLRLRNYQPPAAIVQLADDTTMNASTRQLFYVYHPALQARSEFSQNCPSHSEKTIILGCYIAHRGIYLFDVGDTRLKGIEQVTAAHEMLHAAYDRLSADEREYVTTMVNDAYKNSKDERLKSTIAAYQNAGDDVANELHSILGTEVRELPPALEAYYSRYFTDRKKIVSYSESYENEFTTRENNAKTLLSRIDAIAAELPARRAVIDSLEQSLNNQRGELDRERGSATDVSAFNAKVSAYNNQVVLYRQKIAEYNQLVNEHNDLLGKYNAVALEENQLIQAIDSRSASIPSE